MPSYVALVIGYFHPAKVNTPSQAQVQEHQLASMKCLAVAASSCTPGCA